MKMWFTNSKSTNKIFKVAVIFMYVIASKMQASDSYVTLNGRCYVNIQRREQYF